MFLKWFPHLMINEDAYFCGFDLLPFLLEYDVSPFNLLASAQCLVCFALTN